MTITVNLDRRPTDMELAVSTSSVRRMQMLGTLGLYARTLLPDYASRLGYDAGDRGVLILRSIEVGVDTGLIKPEELIVACNGRSVKTVAALLRVLEDAEKGKPVKLEVVNADGERRTVRYLWK